MFGKAKHFALRIVRKYGSQEYAQYSTENYTKELNHRQVDDPKSILRRTYGQPTLVTHPHIIKEGELVPGIKLDEFKKRRSKFMENIISQSKLKNPGKAQIVIIPSSSKVYMSDKIPYVFRQNTDFLYLTGCQEPDSILVITEKNENFVSTLFLRQKDAHSELWDGPRTGIEAAPCMFAMEQALPVAEFKQFFLSFINKNKKNVIWYDNVNVIQPNLHKMLSEMVKITDDQSIIPPTNILHRLRLIKSKSEIELMKQSCQIVSSAITETIRASKPGMSEHQLFAIVDYECRMNGAEFLAYPPVVAGGKNANVIHYIMNNQIIQSGNMVLMDAGCEYHGYSSDVTRTWPINGKFTMEQRILYEIVLDVQAILIKRLKEMPTLDHLFHNMCSLLGKRLQEIGLIPKNITSDKLLAAAYTYCPHHVSHYLGMDVHDTGTISRNIKIQPGMIITVEPGIYVNPKNRLALPEFHGLGIRIEDDVLVTENDPLILTRNCPKDIVEIEALACQN